MLFESTLDPSYQRLWSQLCKPALQQPQTSSWIRNRWWELFLSRSWGICRLTVANTRNMRNLNPAFKIRMEPRWIRARPDFRRSHLITAADDRHGSSWMDWT